MLEDEYGIGGDGDGWFELLRPQDMTRACGDVGDGAMMEWTEIVKVVEERLGLGASWLPTSYAQREHSATPKQENEAPHLGCPRVAGRTPGWSAIRDSTVFGYADREPCLSHGPPEASAPHNANASLPGRITK